MAEAKMVKAAGGIVQRKGADRQIEVLLVHRPVYDDWTFPKGKLDADETVEEAALREVEEETGFECKLVREVGCTSYVDRKGRDKTVCYWIMKAVNDSGFRPTGEIDKIRWVTIEDAEDLLTYQRDLDLLGAARL